MTGKVFSIAIDGPAGAGKSTIAKALAADLDAMYLDTGAMYRAFGLYMLRKGAVNDTAAIISSVDEVDIGVEYMDGTQHIFLGGEDVSRAIREPEVSMAASAVSAVPEVRARRRCRELEEKGMPEPYERVLEEMIRRDHQDTHRAASPLRPAEDAQRVDTSDLTLEQSVEVMRQLALMAIREKCREG